MKRKIVISLASFIGLFTLIFLFNYFFGLLTPYNFFTAKTTLSKGKVYIVTFGEPVRNMQKIQAIAGKYGFQYSGGGCIVTTPELNGSKYYNRVMEGFLEKRNGLNWKTQFEKEVDSLFSEQNERAMDEKRCECFIKEKTSCEIIKFHQTAVFDTITVVVRGRLLDLGNNKGLCSTKIRIRDNETITDSTGVFSFIHIQGGKVEMLISNYIGELCTVNSIDLGNGAAWELNIGIPCKNSQN